MLFLIPNNCNSWYDGCNICSVSNGIIRTCTRIMCFSEDEPYCITYDNGH